MHVNIQIHIQEVGDVPEKKYNTSPDLPAPERHESFKIVADTREAAINKAKSIFDVI